jgi:hypothetical protein
MADWSMEDLAREIERRRGARRRRAAAARETDEEAERALKDIQDWSDEDWAQEFTRRHGFKARPWWIEQVESRGVWRGQVRALRLKGQAVPWRGYAWAVMSGVSLQFRSAIHAGAIRSAREAVRSGGV